MDKIGHQSLAQADLRTVTLSSPGVTDGVFWLYLYFLVDFFLHLSQRIPGYSVLRPTLLLVALISGFLFLQKERIKDRTNDPIFRAILVLLVYLVVSWPLVEYQGSVLTKNLPEFVKAIVFLFFTALIVDTRHRLKLFLLVFVGCQVIRVLEPLYMNVTEGYWGGSTHIGGGEFAGRLGGAPSDVINPNELGFVIATAAPFLHYLLFTGRWKAKVLYLLLVPCLLYAMILTMSRGGFLALLVVGWFIFKESSHKLILILVAIAIGIGGWSVMNPLQKDRYLSLFVDDAQGSASASGRLGGMMAEFKLGFNRPIVGHGVGTTPEVKANTWGSVQASHNMYGELLIEIGIIGFVLFMRYIIEIYRRFMKNRDIIKNLEDNPENFFYHNLNKALIAVFWMYAVYSLNYWGLSQYYWYLFGGMAIAFGHVLRHEASAKDSDSAEASPIESKYSLAWSVRNRAG